jgi:serine/threonine-protein kinase
MPTGTPEVDKVRGALGDRYRIERVIGEGGMATVYLAEDLKHRRKVAVKVMRPELAATLGAERFLREVEIAAQLNHPHILPMYDSGASEGLLFYVMPWIEGESLQARLRREGQLPVEEAVRLAREVAEALAAAHALGIIHRDIKPANILLNAGHALVADFGIARALGTGGEALTKTGLAVGTPQYMSPEQATGGHAIDGRSDVYAVGAVLYEMLAGEPPFTGPTAQAIMARSLTEVPRPLTMSRDLSPQVDAVVRRALAKSPADRQPSAAALAEALGSALDAARSGATPVVATDGPTGAQVWGLFGVTSAVSLGLVYALISRWGLPSWTFGLAVLLLAIGAAVLVVTGQVEARRRGGATPGGLRRLFTWRNAAIGGGLALALWALVATGMVMRGPAGGAASRDGIRLAVLPFENRGSSEDAYFAAGITDEIRGKLTALPNFQVTARTSSDQYRESTKPLQQIGRELGVDYLLTATVRWARTPDGKGRVQVVPELIDARSGAATWQQTFDADVTDVFQVQTTIAIRVAGALGVALGTSEEQQLTRRPTENLAAYDLYLKGQALTANDPNTLKQASGYFEQAAALDSTFLEAWARLSSTLSSLYFNGTPDPVIARRAKEAAERSIALDPSSAFGHVAMSVYQASVLKDTERAEQEMALALKAAPNDPEMLRRSASVERALGRWDAALNHLERARRLDPRSVPTLGAATGLFLSLRRYDEALAAGAELLALAPTDPNHIQLVVMTHLAKGDLAAARAVIKAAPGSLAEPALIAYLATYNDLYWVLDEAQQRILLRLPPSAFFDDPAAWGSVFMQTYAQRGDQARARAYADTAHAAFEAQLRDAPTDPQLHTLNGLALAYAGRYDEAIAAGERGVALLPISKDAQSGTYYQHQLVRIYILAGNHEKALDRLEPLLQVPYHLSPGWLRIDPAFAPLKGNPRFEKLLAGS